MKKTLNLTRRLVPAALCGVMMACAPVDGDVEATDLEVNTQNLFANPNQGDIASRETVTGVLDNGDFGHMYSFQAGAGERVTFAVEFEDVGGRSRGAAIQVRDAFGTLVAEHRNTESQQAHVTHTFSAAGTYRVYVKQARFSLFGSFPYTFGANPDLCLVLEGIDTDFDPEPLNFFSAVNFPETLEEDPWGFEPEDPGFILESQEVHFGDCAELMVEDCGSEGPEVVKVSFPSGDAEVVANECTMQNEAFETAGTEGGWGLWWDVWCFPLGCEE